MIANCRKSSQLWTASKDRPIGCLRRHNFIWRQILRALSTTVSLVQMDVILVRQKEQKSLVGATRHIFWAHNVPKMLLPLGLLRRPHWGSSPHHTGAPPHTTLGQLTTLPRPPSWIWGLLHSRQRRKGKREEVWRRGGEEGQEREGRNV